MKPHFYKLLDSEYKGMVIRQDIDHSEWYYDIAANQWKRIGILMDSLLPFGDKFEQYTELTDDEVKQYA